MGFSIAFPRDFAFVLFWSFFVSLSHWRSYALYEVKNELFNPSILHGILQISHLT